MESNIAHTLYHTNASNLCMLKGKFAIREQSNVKSWSSILECYHLVGFHLVVGLKKF